MNTNGTGTESLQTAINNVTLVGHADYSSDPQSFGVGAVHNDTVALTVHLYQDKDARAATVALAVQMAEETNRQTFDQTVVFVGHVIEDNVASITFEEGLQMFGNPFSGPMGINDTTLFADGAKGATAVQNADLIIDMKSGQLLFGRDVVADVEPHHASLQAALPVACLHGENGAVASADPQVRTDPYEASQHPCG